MARMRTDKSTFLAASSDPRSLAAGAGWVTAIVATSAGDSYFTLYDGADVLFVGNISLRAYPMVVDFEEPLYFENGLSCDPGACDVLLTVKGNERR